MADARQRIGLRLIAACAEALGVELPAGWEDPADILTGLAGDAAPERPSGQAGRAAQIQAFLDATGGEAG